MHAYFEKPTKEGVYFVDSKQPTKFQDIDCLDILDNQYLEFRSEQSELVKKKREFIGHIDKDMKGHCVLVIFEELNKVIDDPDLYEEIVWVTFLLTKFLKFYTASQLCLDLLMKRYPNDEFLVVKQAQLYWHRKQVNELDLILYKRKELKIEYYQNLMIMLQMKDYLKNKKDEETAHNLYEKLVKRNPQDTWIQIEMLYYNLKRLDLKNPKNMKQAEINFKFVYSMVEEKGHVIEQRHIYKKYHKCKKILAKENVKFYTEEQRRADNLTASKIAAIKTKNLSVSDNNEIQLKESNRSKDYESKRTEEFEHNLEETRQANELKEKNAQIGEFCEAFLEECERMYNNCRYISDSAIEKEIKGNTSMSVVFFCLDKVNIAGGLLNKGLMWLLKNQKKKVLQNQYRDIQKFAPTHEIFQRHVHQIFNKLILKPNFQRLIGEVESDSQTTWGGFFKFIKGFIDKGEKKSRFQQLGISAAIGFVNHFIFDSRRIKASLDVVVESIYMDLQFAFHNMSMPPKFALESNNYSSLYYGFLDMSRYVYRAAINELHSYCPVRQNTKFVLLYKKEELFANRRESLIVRAKDVFSFFGSEDALVEIVQDVFKIDKEDHAALLEKLKQILSNLQKLDFELEEYLEGIKFLAKRKKIEDDEDLMKFYARNNILSKKVGGMCAFLAISQADLKISNEKKKSDVIVDNIVRISFNNKGVLKCLVDRVWGKCFDVQEDMK